ncbi:MAG: hypothetical protein F4X11_07990 [Acidobacteria bacterium]|nr:hypothetical protein [Acidobacteriota bacterium]
MNDKGLAEDLFWIWCGVTFLLRQQGALPENSDDAKFLTVLNERMRDVGVRLSRAGVLSRKAEVPEAAQRALLDLMTARQDGPR